MRGWLALAMLFGSAGHAHADAEPVVVVVESAHAGIQPAAIREAISSAGQPTLSFLDPGARSIAVTVTIAVGAEGRDVRIHVATRGGVAQVRFVSARQGADAAGRWIARPVVALVRRVRAAEREEAVRISRLPPVEVLDPWEGDAPSQPVLAEVLDPWGGGPARMRTYVAPTDDPNAEVLDPWDGAALHATQIPSALVDPWSHHGEGEDASRLSRPRPAQPGHR